MPRQQRPTRPAANDDLSPLDRAERLALRLLALHQVSLAIGAQSDPTHTLELILTQARSILRAPAGSICLSDENTGDLHCKVAHDRNEAVLGREVGPGDGLASVAFRDCKTVLINNYPTWAGASDIGREAGIRAAVGVPLRMGDRLLGALTVHTDQAGQTFDEEDAWLLELLGDQAAIALEQARLVEQAELRAARLLALHRVSTAMSAQSDVGSMLKLILSQAALLLKRKGGAIHLWDEPSKTLKLAEQHGLPRDRLSASVSPGQGISGQVWLHGAPLVVDNYPEWQHSTPRGIAAGMEGAVVGVPLSVAGRKLGVLTLVAGADAPTFHPEEVQILELFAGQAAVAIENARLFDVAIRSRAMEQLDQLKSEFISAVSHELRTPLTYIHGYSELLLERDFAPEMATQAMGEIHGASVKMSQLVDDLLDLSRLESGRLILRPRKVDLKQILDGAADVLRSERPDRQVEVQVQPLTEAVADPDRLRQVIDNLLKNADSYAPSGSITLRGLGLENGLRIEVTDEGPGISPEDQSRVFEPFYRGRKSELLPLRGGGLGLTLVRRLVEAHGGQVGVDSQPGQGSTFWFTIPTQPARTAE